MPRAYLFLRARSPCRFFSRPTHHLFSIYVTTMFVTMARFDTALALLLAVLLYSSSFISARSLDSTELSIGDWNVTMKCRRSFFTSDVFPPRVALEQQPGQNIQRQRRWLPPWADAPQSFGCHLSLFSNGTFALQPRDEESWNELAGTNTNAINSDNNGEPHVHHEPQYLAVHGRWKVQSNPYCVTDRSFDEVTLASFPRVQTRITRNSEQMESQESVVSSKRLRLLLHCRLSGHYTNGGLARKLQGNDSYSRGRISRGVILSQNQPSRSQQQDNTNTNTNNNIINKPWWQSHNKVVASFSARRRIPPGFSMDDEDNLSEYEE